jgi:hypothetical protein
VYSLKCVIRPHQNLDGKTPAEVWRGIDIFKNEPKKEYWFDAWDGLLVIFQLHSPVPFSGAFPRCSTLCWIF